VTVRPTPPDTRNSRWSAATAAAVVVLGVERLLVALSLDPAPGLNATGCLQFAPAVACLLAGLALLLQSGALRAPPSLRRTALLGWMVGLIGLGLLLSAWVLLPGSGWALQTEAWQTDAILPAARPGAVAGCCLLLLGAALAIARWRGPSRALAFTAGLMALFVLTGHVYGLLLHGAGSAIAPQTQLATPPPLALALLLLAVGCWRLDPHPLLPIHGIAAHAMVSLALLLPMAASWRLWVRATTDAVETSAAAFTRQVERVEVNLRQVTDRHERVLRDAAALLAVSPDLSRAQWARYVDGLAVARTLPGTQGIGVARHLQAGEQAAFEQRMRREASADFHIWPARPDDEQTVVTYLQPEDGRNRRAVGFNLNTEPIRRRALDCARRTGAPCASSRVTLLQETDVDVQAGLLVYMPVELDDSGRLYGFAYEAFRMRDMMQSTLHGLERELALEIYDGPTARAEALLYRDPGFAPQRHALYQQERVLQVFGRLWLLRVQSSTAFDVAALAARPVAIRHGGVVILLLCFGFLGLLVLQRSTALSRAQQQGQALERLNVEYRQQHQALMKANAQLEVEVQARLRSDEALRESGLRFSTLTDASPLGIFAADADGRCQYVNPSHERITGQSMLQSLGRGYQDALHPDDRQRLIATGHRAALGDGPKTVEVRYVRPDRSVVWTRMTLAPLFDRAQFLGVVGVVEDITTAREQQQRIAAALSEKEMLLKEVYHRVKNNLQVIQSLLSLQSRSLPDGLARGVVLDMVQRIRAMALVHEKLYQSGNLAAVPLRDYLQDLGRHLADAEAVDRRRIQLAFDVAAVDVGLDIAVPIGLLVTELVSNSLKHAFPAQRGGEVTVLLHPGPGDSLVLSVADDGVGLPFSFDPLQTSSMGLKLAVSLARQLGGELVFSSHGGTIASVQLPKP
jgi:PAS domain S-box-containing protein